MLVLSHISKNYGVGKSINVQALKDVSLSFREHEFVSVLGPSGCGKTSLLNIIGGLDRYSSGDLIINGRSTKKFKDKDWDAYRNNTIGFVFQNYNLISHISVLENVEMALKISGVSGKERRKRAIEALEKVGLSDQLKKRPNQMSGGQMQRVAIARALVNDPDVILADEPTGALDSSTSVVVMELLKEVAKDRLVIMVTHNNDLADTYSDRIIRLKDGAMISDSHPYDEKQAVIETDKVTKKSKMSYMTALGLSGANLISKRWRTLLISFAGSIGIIGIALVLAISNGFNAYIKTIQKDTLSSMPITVTKQALTITANDMSGLNSGLTAFPSGDSATIYSMRDSLYHSNTITQDYVEYVKKMDPSLYSDLSFDYGVTMNLITLNDSVYQHISSSEADMTKLPTNENNFYNVYEVIKGSKPTTANQLLIMVDQYNRVSKSTLSALGYTVSDETTISLDDLLGKTYKVIDNNAYYVKNSRLFSPAKADQYEDLYNASTTALEVVGVARVKADYVDSAQYSSGLFYSAGLSDQILVNSRDSEIVKEQLKVGADYDVTSGMKFSLLAASSNQTPEAIYEARVASLGGAELPTTISITPIDFETKTKLLSYLDDYNAGKDEASMIKYSDMSSLVTGVMNTLVSTISYVLIAFSAISLVVSSLMIGIITYVSVIERTKEIGVLRSLGARKKDISRVFNAETIIIGLVAGILGILISYGLTFPISSIVEKLVNVKNMAQLDLVQSIVLIMISMILTLIAGLIPSRIAAKKDPVEALRTE